MHKGSEQNQEPKIPCDASRAWRGKSSQNGCRNRTPTPYTNQLDVISRDDASSWVVWSAVPGRSRRLDEVEKRQRRYDLSPHGDRRLLESGLVCSHEEQVRGVVGGSAANHVRRHLAKDVADRSRRGISEQISSGSIAALRYPSLLHAQRGDEGERRGTIQQNVEDGHVAILNEIIDLVHGRYIDVLQDLVRSYNNTHHRRIGIAPLR